MIQLNPIAIAATSQQYMVRVEENLCQSFCLTNSVQPQGNITFSVGGINVVDGTVFVTINVNGSIAYQPNGCNPCCTKTKLFSESFVVGFTGTGTPTIDLTVGGQSQSAENVKCNNRAYGWSITSDLTIAATFPS